MLKDRSFIVQGGIFAALAVLIVVSFIFVIPMLSKPVVTKKVGCEAIGTEHRATIKNAVISPKHIKAKLCDTLIIVNNDSIKRRMVFGAHDKLINYNDNSEILLLPGEKSTLDLNITGTYIFHDHDEETVSANFTVAE